jgi:hypothetical protein
MRIEPRYDHTSAELDRSSRGFWSEVTPACADEPQRALTSSVAFCGKYVNG